MITVIYPHKTSYNHCLACNTKELSQALSPALADEIVQTVCDHFGMTLEKIKDRCRERPIVQARFFCFLFLRKYTKLSLKNVGSFFGVDHTSVIHGVGTIQDMIDTEDATRRHYEQIDELVKAMQN